MTEREDTHPSTAESKTPMESEKVSLQPSKTLLRQTRESTGIHLATLAVTLKVPVARLEALEAGRYEELPDPTFARALAKSVCKVLKVDPEPILATLPSAHVADLGPSATAISTPMPVTREGAIMGSGESMVRVPSAVLVAAVLMTLAVTLWFLLPERIIQSPAESSVAAPSLGASPHPLAELTTASGAEDASAEAPTSEVSVALTEADSSTSNNSLAPTPLAEGLVQIVASDTVWIEVVGSSGRVLAQRSLETQESVAFSNDLPLSVVIGRADVAEVRVRDQAFDLQPWTRGNVARFEVQ